MISILQIYLQADVELKTAETAGQEVAGAEEESVEEICETCESVEQPQILADQQDPAEMQGEVGGSGKEEIPAPRLQQIDETCESVEQPQILADQQAESESRARPRSLSKMVDY